MKIKAWLKKICPPTIFILNREISSLKECNESLAQRLDAVQRGNAELLKRTDEMQRSIRAAQDALSGKAGGLSSALDRVISQEAELRDAMEDIGNTVHGRPSSSLYGYECFSTNVVKQMWEIAGRESAVFVMEKMAKRESLPDAAALREFALKRAGEGLYLEFGVFSGISINQIARLKPEQTVYGFDSFEGLPETWRDGFEAGTFQKGVLPKVEKNVVLVKGWFNKSLPGFLTDHPGDCAFIHIDCDLYSSAKTVLTLLGQRIVSGTVIVFDEYFNYPSWQKHEHKAFTEFLKEHGRECDYFGYVGSHQQVAAVIK